MMHKASRAGRQERGPPLTMKTWTRFQEITCSSCGVMANITPQRLFGSVD